MPPSAAGGIGLTGQPFFHSRPERRDTQKGVLVEVRMEFTTALRDGYAAAVTNTVQAVTGRPPRTFDAFAREHAALFRGTI